MIRFLIVCLFLPILGAAQLKYTSLYNPLNMVVLDTLPPIQEIEQEKHPKVGKFLFTIDSRQSNVAGQWTKMNGVRLGMELMERYRFGFGFYNLGQRIRLDPLIRGTDTLHSLLDFQYNTLFTEYVFYKDFKWVASAIMSYGNGQGSIHQTSSETGLDTVRVIPKIPIFAANVAAYYYVLPWIAPGFGVGYRAVPASDSRITKVFSSPFYVFKLKIVLGKLYKSIFKPEIIRKEREEYRKERAARIKKRKDKRENSQDSNG